MIARISLPQTGSLAVGPLHVAAALALLVAAGLQCMRVAGVSHRSGADAPQLQPLMAPAESVAGPPVTLARRVVVVLPTRPAPSDAEERARRHAVRRLTGILDRVGVPYASLSQSGLSLAALRPYTVAVLPGNRLTAGETQSLRAYAAGGGRLLALLPRGPDALYTLFGVSCTGVQGPAFARQFRYVNFPDADLLPGFPAQMEQDSERALTLSAMAGTRVLGLWQVKGQPSVPAVTANAAGILVGDLLTADDPQRKRDFLLAALAHLDSSVWGQAAGVRRAATLKRLGGQKRRWVSLRARPDLSGRAASVQRYTAAAGAALQGVPALPPSDAKHGRDAYRQVEAAEHTLDCLESAMTPAPKGELRGFWIHTYRPTDWDSVMAQAKAGGLNAAFVRVGRGGNVIYPTDLLPRDPWAEEAGGDELQRAIEAARRHGLAFHAWRVLYHLGSASEEYQNRMAAEDRVVRDPAGRQHPWANPGDPRNQDLEVRVALDVVKRYDVDGYHLDYVRYPEVPSIHFDYGDVSRREFEREARVRVKRWPADVTTGFLRGRYEEWQRGNISRLVRRIYQGVKAAKPGVQVSAAVWRRYPWCREGVRQDWPLWVRQGWLDFVVPMNYVLDAEKQGADVRAQVRATGGRRPLMAGIGSWQLQSSGEVLAQIRAARAAGAKGFVLFSFNDETIARHLEVLAAGACAP